MDNSKKLEVLSRVGQALNGAKVTWAVGASLLLYLNGMTGEFHDIDIMTTVEDAERVKAALLRLGTLAPPNPDKQYKTRRFLEFCVDGVDIDVIAGFVIVRGGVDYDCSLRPETITGSADVNGVTIPLQSLTEWRKYYQLMGRMSKVAMIDGESKIN